MSVSAGRLASAAFALVLLVSAPSLADSGAASPQPQASVTDAAPAPDPKAAAPISAAQVAELYKGMSSAAREALEQLLKTKGVDGLSKMSESDARKTFGAMAPNVRDEIQAKWDGLTDEQRDALKKLKPDDIRDMAASQAKEIVQASVAPIMKPVEAALEDTKKVASKTASILKRGRDYVQRLIARLTGSARSEDRPQGDANPADRN